MLCRYFASASYSSFSKSYYCNYCACQTLVGAEQRPLFTQKKPKIQTKTIIRGLFVTVIEGTPSAWPRHGSRVADSTGRDAGEPTVQSPRTATSESVTFLDPGRLPSRPRQLGLHSNRLATGSSTVALIPDSCPGPAAVAAGPGPGPGK